MGNLALVHRWRAPRFKKTSTAVKRKKKKELFVESRASALDQYDNVNTNIPHEMLEVRIQWPPTLRSCHAIYDLRAWSDSCFNVYSTIGITFRDGYERNFASCSIIARYTHEVRVISRHGGLIAVWNSLLSNRFTLYAWGGKKKNSSIDRGSECESDAESLEENKNVIGIERHD